MENSLTEEETEFRYNQFLIKDIVEYIYLKLINKNERVSFYKLSCLLFMVDMLYKDGGFLKEGYTLDNGRCIVGTKSKDYITYICAHGCELRSEPANFLYLFKDIVDIADKVIEEHGKTTPTSLVGICHGMYMSYRGKLDGKGIDQRQEENAALNRQS